jgi:hypothetical protein
MRRTLFALAVFAAAALLVTATSCTQRSHVLRVVDINKGMRIMSDIADWYLYNDPQIPDSEEDFQYITFFDDESASVEFQYVEVGAGLPTWSPFQATIYTYTIWYSEAADTAVKYDSIVVPTTVSVMADPAGKKTATAYLKIVDADWKRRLFGGHIGDAPDDGDGFTATLLAKMRFIAYDSIANRTDTTWANTTVDVSDFWDDPSSFRPGGH